MKWSTSSLRADYREPGFTHWLSGRVQAHYNQIAASRPIVLVCIGTDRSTGDSLGPLVGSMLSKRRLDGITIYGTLNQPVHALNLSDTINEIEERFTHPFIIAVDACLGQHESIGIVQVGSGPMKPGAGVNKDLPPVGNMHITGIVNVGGFMEYLVLQNTRLSIVMQMAELISEGLIRSLLVRKTSFVTKPAMNESSIKVVFHANP